VVCEQNKYSAPHSLNAPLEALFWMSSNRLNLNASKTQFIWFGTPQRLQKLDFDFPSKQFPLISLSSSV